MHLGPYTFSDNWERKKVIFVVFLALCTSILFACLAENHVPEMHMVFIVKLCIAHWHCTFFHMQLTL